MRATIASLLEVDADKVPHFMHDGCPDSSQFNVRVNDFLRPMNLGYLPMTCSGEYLASNGIRGMNHEIAGQTERGTYHACAAMDGVLTHDPHPTHAGLEKIEEFGVFIVLDPSKPIGKP